MIPINKFQNKFRTKSIRASYWDYGWNAAYFVTINARNHEYLSGDKINGVMERLAIWQIAGNLWLKIPFGGKLK